MIRRARGRGSVTPELIERLRRHQHDDRVEILEETAVLAARYDEGRGTVRVTFDRDRREETFRRVWCGTGFEPRLERLSWLGPLAGVAQCEGRPLIGSTLEISPGCFVTGWLAELWLGPAARNISGARQAARVIAGALRTRRAERVTRFGEAA